MNNKNNTIPFIKIGSWNVLPLLFFIAFSFKGIEKKSTVIPIKENAVIEKIKERSNNSILICAHRCFHKNAPENSIQAIKDAIKAKIDFAEMDIRTTKDSVLVLMHDKSIDRTTNGVGSISDYTYEELQKFNLKIGDSVTSHKIPLVRDALKMSKGKIILDLDLKAVNYRQLYKMLHEFKMEHEVISFIASKNEAANMLSIDPLYALLPWSNSIDDMNFYNEKMKSPLQHFTNATFTTENMKWAKENRKIIFVNTLWKEDEDFLKGNTQSMDRVIALKPNIIQTDHPKMLLDYLRKKGLHK